MKSKFLKNTTWLIMGHIVQMGMQFIVGLLTTRFLGPTNYGTIHYVASYISFFTSFCELGMSSVMIKELVTNKEQEGQIMATCSLLRFLASIISMFAVCATIYIVDSDDKTIFYIAIIEAVKIPFAVSSVVNYWLQSRLESKYTTIITSGAHFCTAAYKIYLLAAGKSIYWFAASTTVEGILLAILFWIVYLKKRNKFYAHHYSKEIAGRMLKAGSPFIMASLMIQICQQTDKIMLRQILGSTKEVGLYTAVTTICVLLGFVSTAILDSARPVIMELKKSSEQMYEIRIRQLFAVLIWFNVLYALGVTFFSRQIIYVLYGEQYLSANTCLKICVWYTVFSYLGGAKSLWLICEEKNNLVFVFSAFGALVNVVMNLILIPKMGLNGAAMATLLTQVMANVGAPCLLRSTHAYVATVCDAATLKGIQVKSLLENIKSIVNRQN